MTIERQSDAPPIRPDGGRSERTTLFCTVPPNALICKQILAVLVVSLLPVFSPWPKLSSSRIGSAQQRQDRARTELTLDLMRPRGRVLYARNIDENECRRPWRLEEIPPNDHENHHGRRSSGSRGTPSTMLRWVENRKLYAMPKSTVIEQAVFEQSCAEYLRSLGISAKDGIGMNCPHRADSDSAAFFTDGPFHFDHATGEGGNVLQLALKMHGGDRDKALRSLFAAAGMPYRPKHGIALQRLQRAIAEDGLEKVWQHFGLREGVTPPEVLDYVAQRGITGAALRYLAYIPPGDLDSVLNEEQQRLTGLAHRQGMLVLWYFRNGRPVYYCTREIKTKAFKKAPTEFLQHPIWNVDWLYSDCDVIWGEGFFDVLSLIELGHFPAGEITCHAIHAHFDELLTALRWRRKHLPDRTVTICLDNDGLTEKTQRRPGNEAAERLALRLLLHGVDVRWVKHDPTDTKIDINDLHVQGRESEIHQMLASAKPVSELLKLDEAQCREIFQQAAADGDFGLAEKVLQHLRNNGRSSKFAQLVNACWRIRRPYTEFYRGVELCQYDDKVFVRYHRKRYGPDQKNWDVFRKAHFIDNLRAFQRNPQLNLTADMIDIPSRRPTWFVEREPDAERNNQFNLFEPSPLLLQEPVDPPPEHLPRQWWLVLSNLGGQAEVGWLLNHLATFVQELEKPRTIPILLSGQGTGKNALMENFGKGIGGFACVSREVLEGAFNSYLMNPVILFDELVSNPRDAKNVKNRLKALINETQTLNAKNEKLITARLNNYVAIASNEQLTSVPVVIDPDDRRFTVICGGWGRNLATMPEFSYEQLVEELPDFMLYLLSRPIDVAAANVPHHNETRARIMALSLPLQVQMVEEVASQAGMHNGQEVPVSLLKQFIDGGVGKSYRCTVTSQELRHILERLGYCLFKRNNQWWCRLNQQLTPQLPA